MRRLFASAIVLKLGGATVFLGMIGAAGALAGEKPTFASMAPVAQYRMASRADEIALARSAAPASISIDAGVLVLGDHGYETAVEGKNGFVCLVERSWFASFDDPVFWNPTIRGPDCLNPPAVKTVLPFNLEKTRWVLAGLSKAEMLTRAQSSAAAQQAPAPGAMGFMMSKQQHLSDADGHWHPHLMFFQPHTAAGDWGANLAGSPVFGAVGKPDEPQSFLFQWENGRMALRRRWVCSSRPQPSGRAETRQLPPCAS